MAKLAVCECLAMQMNQLLRDGIQPNIVQYSACPLFR